MLKNRNIELFMMPRHQCQPNLNVNPIVIPNVNPTSKANHNSNANPNVNPNLNLLFIIINNYIIYKK